jgi:nucleotide-binding universal stress UspA family protein
LTLLIAVKDAKADRDLVKAARALAKAAGWEAGVVHVRESPGEAELEQDAFGDIAIAELNGAPAPTIRLLVDEAGVDALAMGLRRTARAGLGHVPGALLGRLSAPLLLVRPGMRPLTTVRRLLVPLEGSPSTSDAMRYADDLFCRRGRELLILHVVTGDVPGETGSLPAPRLLDQEHYEWAEWKEEFSMRFSQCSKGGRHRVRVRVGDVATAIVEEALQHDTDLIVLSWCGSLQEGRGVTVRELLETAPCPLLIVPASAPVIDLASRREAAGG